MIDLTEFRRGAWGVPLSDSDTLPECCFRCPYLVTEEYTVCFVADPFYYYCAFAWPDRLTQTVPPCLSPASG